MEFVVLPSHSLQKPENLLSIAEQSAKVNQRLCQFANPTASRLSWDDEWRTAMVLAFFTPTPEAPPTSTSTCDQTERTCRIR